MSAIDELYPLVPPRTRRHRRQYNGRPNYNQIHAHPLPLSVHPLPPLVPHNPLSVLHIAYVYASQWIRPSSSHFEPRLRGYHTPSTNSVHVTDPSSVQILWSHGFFGKGSLSRSEPTWLEREKKRLGLLAADTSEEHTAARRAERKRFKIERARKEREAIDEKLMEELLVERIACNHNNNLKRTPRPGDGGGDGGKKAGKPTLRSKYEGLAEAALLSPTKGVGFFGGERMLPTPPTTPTPDSVSKNPPRQERDTTTAAAKPFHNATVELSITPVAEKPMTPEITNQEHLQLTPEEAFFLTYALGILDIYPEPSPPPSQQSLNPIKTSHLLTLLTTTTPHPNDPFLLLYTTYHHFRSLGWVVRPGIKFGVDYLLYLRGPVFSHAEFAVTILPAYTHPFWRTGEGRAMRGGRQGVGGSPDDVDGGVDLGKRSWHWLHCVQRVQSQVRKTLIVAWVDVPPPLGFGAGGVSEDDDKDDEDEDVDKVDITAMLKRYRIREMVMKRWIPNRSRD